MKAVVRLADYAPEYVIIHCGLPSLLPTYALPTPHLSPI